MNPHTEQAHADIRELVAQVVGAYEPTPEEVERLHEGLTEILQGLGSLLTHWQANHADVVKRASLLSQRLDLPVDRIPAYQEMKRLQERNRKVDILHKALEEIKVIYDTVPSAHHYTKVLDLVEKALAEFELCQDRTCEMADRPHAHIEVLIPAQLAHMAIDHEGQAPNDQTLTHASLAWCVTCSEPLSLARQKLNLEQCFKCLPDVTPVTHKTISYTEREAALLLFVVESMSKTDVLRQFIERVLK